MVFTEVLNSGNQVLGEALEGHEFNQAFMSHRVEDAVDVVREDGRSD